MTKVWHNRRLLLTGVLTCLLNCRLCVAPPQVRKGLQCLSGERHQVPEADLRPKQQPLAYREDYTGGFAKWQQDAREALRQKIGLSKIAASVGDHQPVVKLDEPEDLRRVSGDRRA